MARESAERQSNSVIIVSFLIEHSSWPIREQEIVQFRVHYDRWIKEVKTHFLQA